MEKMKCAIRFNINDSARDLLNGKVVSELIDQKLLVGLRDINLEADSTAPFGPKIVKQTGFQFNVNTGEWVHRGGNVVPQIHQELEQEEEEEEEEKEEEEEEDEKEEGHGEGVGRGGEEKEEEEEDVEEESRANGVEVDLESKGQTRARNAQEEEDLELDPEEESVAMDKGWGPDSSGTQAQQSTTSNNNANQLYEASMGNFTTLRVELVASNQALHSRMHHIEQT